MDTIVVFCCKRTKQVHLATTTQKIKGEGLARMFLKEVVRHHGVPHSIISDRDPRYMGGFWQELHRIVGTRLSMSTSRRPETDGQTERANRTLEELLRHYVNLEEGDWDEHLCMAEFAINSSKATTTGVSPFKMLYGREVPTPAALLLGKEDRQKGLKCPAVGAYLDLSSKAFQGVKARVETQQTAQSKEYARRHRREKFAVGQKVLLRAGALPLTGNSVTKFSQRFHGPFEIKKVYGERRPGMPTQVRLALPPHLRLHDVFNVDKLEVWHETERWEQRRLRRPPPIYVSQEGEFFEVDYLANRRPNRRRGGHDYLVHWKDYSVHDRTWEHENDLHCPQALRDYHRRHGLPAPEPRQPEGNLVPADQDRPDPMETRLKRGRRGSGANSRRVSRPTAELVAGEGPASPRRSRKPKAKRSPPSQQRIPAAQARQRAEQQHGEHTSVAAARPPRARQHSANGGDSRSPRQQRADRRSGRTAAAAVSRRGGDRHGRRPARDTPQLQQRVMHAPASWRPWRPVDPEKGYWKRKANEDTRRNSQRNWIQANATGRTPRPVNGPMISRRQLAWPEELRRMPPAFWMPFWSHANHQEPGQYDVRHHGQVRPLDPYLVGWCDGPPREVAPSWGQFRGYPRSLRRC